MAAAHKGIRKILKPHEKDLGGFKVRRTLPQVGQRQIGPFVFFDHMGPAEFAPGTGINVRSHPHIGLATVTYLIEGEILHKDSLGFQQIIRPGAINLMIAGEGIVHAEKTRDEIKSQTRKLEGLQLWMALPLKDENCAPSFTHHAAESLPEVNEQGQKIKILMGEAFGKKSPVQTLSPTLYVDCQLAAGKSLTLPEAQERGLYILSGQLKVNGLHVEPCQMILLDESIKIEIEATQDCRFVVLGGEPLGERFIFWNFVSSQKEKIEKAKDKWKSGNFPEVPGETDFIPLPE